MHANVVLNVKCRRPGRDLFPPISLILPFDFTPGSGFVCRVQTMSLSHAATSKNDA